MNYVQLEQIVTIIGGGTPSREVAEYWNGKIPWVSVKDFKSREISDSQEYITELGLNKSASNLIEPNSILTPTRMGLGKVAINVVPVAINQDIKALKVKDSNKVSLRYLAFFLESKSSYIESLGKGATVKGITLDVLKKLEIPLPSIKEQTRIADILDKVDVLRAKRRKTIALINYLTQSIFLEMFGNPATNSKGWNLAPIGSFLESANYGSSQKAGDTGKWPILRMNNLTYSGEMDFSNLKYLDLVEKDVPKYTVKKGDILFNRTNSAELVGKTAVYNEESPMAFAGYLVRLRCTEDNHPEYISALLNSEWGKSTLRGMCKSIIGMANINATEIQKLVVPKPPGDLQKKFGEKISILKTHKGPQNISMRELDELFASIQKKAFSGEL